MDKWEHNEHGVLVKQVSEEPPPPRGPKRFSKWRQNEDGLHVKHEHIEARSQKSSISSRRTSSKLSRTSHRSSSIGVRRSSLELAVLSKAVAVNRSKLLAGRLTEEDHQAQIDEHEQSEARAQNEVSQRRILLQEAERVVAEAKKNLNEAERFAAAAEEEADSIHAKLRQQHAGRKISNFDSIQLSVKQTKVEQQVDAAHSEANFKKQSLDNAEEKLRKAKLGVKQAQAKEIYFNSAKGEAQYALQEHKKQQELRRKQAVAGFIGEAVRIAMQAWAAALHAESEASDYSSFGMHMLNDSGRTTLLPQNHPTANSLELHLEGPVAGKPRTAEGETCFAEKLWRQTSKKNMLPFQHHEIHNDQEMNEYLTQLKQQAAAGQAEDEDGFDPSTIKKFYSLEDLKPPHTGLDPSVNVHHLEMYLSTSDFKKLFAMTKREFQRIPRWKQVSMKWESGLYE